jgi:phage shock protein A
MRREPFKMGVFQRIKEMTKASVHELLDKVEDPIVMLNQYIRDMEEEIAKSEVTVAKQIANERKLKDRVAEAQRLSSKFELQAVEALKNDQESTARQALEQKLHQDEKAAQLLEMYTASKAQAEDLTKQLHEMKEAYYNMRNKRNELVSRAQLAKSKQQMVQVTNLNYIESGSASRGFHRMEEKIIQMEVEAELQRRPNTYATSLAPRVNETKNEQVEAQLATLKEKLIKNSLPDSK